MDRGARDPSWAPPELLGEKERLLAFMATSLKVAQISSVFHVSLPSTNMKSPFQRRKKCLRKVRSVMKCIIKPVFSS